MIIQGQLPIFSLGTVQWLSLSLYYLQMKYQADQIFNSYCFFLANEEAEDKEDEGDVSTSRPVSVHDLEKRDREKSAGKPGSSLVREHTGMSRRSGIGENSILYFAHIQVDSIICSFILVYEIKYVRVLLFSY